METSTQHISEASRPRYIPHRWQHRHGEHGGARGRDVERESGTERGKRAKTGDFLQNVRTPNHYGVNSAHDLLRDGENLDGPTATHQKHMVLQFFFSFLFLLTKILTLTDAYSCFLFLLLLHYTYPCLLTLFLPLLAAT